MSPEAQRIAIAESVGIYLHDGDHAPSNYIFVNDLPDYLNDLNAMHEVEKILTRGQIEIYCEHLNPENYGIWWGINATAAQRAEAFLKTINKWTTNQPTE